MLTIKHTDVDVGMRRFCGISWGSGGGVSCVYNSQWPKSVESYHCE